MALTQRNISIQGRSMAAVAQLWVKSMADKQFNLYGTAILVDLTSTGRFDTVFDTVSRRLNKLLLPIIHSDHGLTMCFFQDEQDNVVCLRVNNSNWLKVKG